ncbi:MAG TPA: ABC transporter permease [Candidatus Acidoferrum sp.]|nr:ABC transporter permease [Candidatus Acidoferrum sp.]
MPLLSKTRSFFRNLLSFGRKDGDLDQEIRSHLEMLIDENIRTGMSAREAECAARIELGGAEQVKEEVRQARIGNWLHSVLSDVRYGLRVLRKSPGFTMVAVLTLALAISANAVVFGVLNAMILRPMNLPREQSLYGIERVGQDDPVVSYPDYLDLRDRNRSFESLAAYRITEAGLDTGETASRIFLFEVSGNYFDALGIQPYLGRFFHASDERGPNSAPYIVFSYTCWHTRFQDDRSVVGRIVQLNKHPFTVVGVAPPEFRGTLLFASPDLFLPMVNEEQIEGREVLSARDNPWIYLALGHLKAGVTSEQAISDLNSIGSYLEKTYPKEHGRTTFSLSRPSLYGDYLGSRVEAFLTGLMLLAGLILIAASANLGGLFAARAADRSREVALRLALGAKRTRILRTFFTEAFLISLAGGALGLWGSVVLLHGLSAWQPLPRYPISVPVSPDANVYAVALLLALVSGLLFGIVPVRQVLRTDPYQIVKAGSAGARGRRITLRDLLLVVQIAICGVLVTSSMVAVRGLVRSLYSNFGFEPRNVMIVSADLRMAGYNGDKLLEMQKRMVEAMRTIPGVESSGLIDWAPLISGAYVDSNIFTGETADLRPFNATAVSFLFKISPEYFHAAHTALISGRTFTWHDDKNAPRVAVVNGEFARKMFGSPAKAIGEFFKIEDGTRVQVVGIVEDGKYKGITEDPRPAMFLPFLQSPSRETMLVVRSTLDPLKLTEAIRNALRELDRGLPSYIETWSKELDNFAFFPSHAATISLGVLGVMGAMLAVTGIFGMAAYSVSKRLKEFGIRMAIGAQRKDVLQAALGRAFRLLAIGSTAGLLLGILASRVLASIVYSATPRDPLVLAGVALAMALLGIVATWIPAQRALSIDPAILLREE